MSRFIADKSIDLSKIDIHEDFGNYPAIFKTPEDIQEFIVERNLKAPVLLNLLKLRSERKLELTPTEIEFYFTELFHYIYDVYRIPIEDTYIAAQNWIEEYVEKELVMGGLNWAIDSVYCSAEVAFECSYTVGRILDRKEQNIINCHNIPTDKYYTAQKDSIIDQFWIKTSSAGQPEKFGDEYYMRVYHWPDRIYIFGCDDCSYTYEGNEEELQKLAYKLKTAAPVWNFSPNLLEYIHARLYFSN